MLGRHHLALSIGTVALVVRPLFTLFPNETIVVLVGAAVGSIGGSVGPTIDVVRRAGNAVFERLRFGHGPVDVPLNYHIR